MTELNFSNQVKKCKLFIMVSKQQNYYIIELIISLKYFLFGTNKIIIKPGSISPLISNKTNRTNWILHNIKSNNHVDL